MTPPKPSGSERLLTALSQECADFKTMLQLLQQEQRLQGQSLDNLRSFKHTTEERLHQLEDFKLASLQRLAFFKGFLRFWPVLVVTLLFAFCIGVFVDDEKVVQAIQDKATFKK